MCARGGMLMKIEILGTKYFIKILSKDIKFYKKMFFKFEPKKGNFQNKQIFEFEDSNLHIINIF